MSSDSGFAPGSQRVNLILGLAWFLRLEGIFLASKLHKLNLFIENMDVEASPVHFWVGKNVTGLRLVDENDGSR